MNSADQHSLASAAGAQQPGSVDVSVNKSSLYISKQHSAWLMNIWHLSLFQYGNANFCG